MVANDSQKVLFVLRDRYREKFDSLQEELRKKNPFTGEIGVSQQRTRYYSRIYGAALRKLGYIYRDDYIREMRKINPTYKPYAKRSKHTITISVYEDVYGVNYGVKNLETVKKSEVLEFVYAILNQLDN